MSQAPLSPEYRMLLACARSHMDEPHASRIRELAESDLDWAKVVALGQHHSVFPLLYKQLAALVAEQVPSVHLQRLRELAQGNAARNLFLFAELQSLLHELTSDGITAIPFKGPALAIAGYGDLSLRRFVDLDVIVPRSELSRAGEAMSRLGYLAWPGDLTSVQREYLFRTQHELPFKRDDGRMMVELHPDMGPRLFAAELDAEDVAKRATQQTFDSGRFLAMDPETVLHALCVHGAKHVWERLAWVCDIAEWIRAHPALDWPRLLDHAQRTGQQRMLFVGLRLASELLDASLPAGVTSLVHADPAVTRLSAQARDVIFSEPRRPPGMITTIRFNMLARRSWMLKWRYVRHMLVASAADVRMFRVPRALQFVYAFVRPFRLLGKREHIH